MATIDDSVLLVRTTLAEVLDLPFDQVRPDASMSTLEPWDSLAHMRLIVLLEQETDCRFADDEIAALASVNDIAEVLAERRP